MADLIDHPARQRPVLPIAVFDPRSGFNAAQFADASAQLRESVGRLQSLFRAISIELGSTAEAIDALRVIVGGRR